MINTHFQPKFYSKLISNFILYKGNYSIVKTENKYATLEDKYLKSREEAERLNKLVRELYAEYAIMAKERDKENMEWEIEK